MWCTLAGMMLLALAFACKPSGEAYTLEVDLQLPPNQLDLFDDIDSVDLLVESDAGTEVFPLTGSSPGDRSELIGLDPLDEATIAIAGYDGGELIAFGRSEALDLSEGELEVSILVARVDDFAWVDMAEGNALGAVAASGTGTFLLFGGADGVVASSSESSDTHDTVWSLPVAPPSADFALEELTTLPPMDEESFEYGSASSPGRMGLTATRLLDGEGILLTGGSVAYTEQTLTSSAAWVFDPQTNTYTELEDLNERRTMHHTAVGPTGQVFIFGGYGSAQLNYINPIRNIDIFDPNTQAITEVTESTRSAIAAGSAARLGADGVLACGGYTLDLSTDVLFSNRCDLIGIEGAVSSAEDLEIGLIWPVMVPLKDDRVMMTGGLAGDPSLTYDQLGTGEATARTFIYDGSSWTEAASMNNPRAMHAAVTLPDGRVLVAGGSTRVSNLVRYYNGTPLACAEIYDPQTDTWTEVMSCNEGNSEASLPLAINRPAFDVDPSYGVLIAGGHTRDGTAVSGAAYFVGQPDL